MTYKPRTYLLPVGLGLGDKDAGPLDPRDRTSFERLERLFTEPDDSSDQS